MRTTSAFFQRKAEEESEIWSNIYGYIVYDAIQMQVSESLSLNGDHIKSIIPPARRTWTLWEHVFSNELFEEYIKHTYKISTEEFNYRCNLSRRQFWYHHWLAKVGFFTANVSSKQFFHMPKFYKMIQLHFYVSKSPKVQLKLFPKTFRRFSHESFKN